ncbi:hypothetical protein GGS24DRAFT_466567 [Hypoxylon argillaceum]|nr:hypothetical protein GGS24DRAFT_466567 [Hypoxylon argillaceum]
MAVASNLHETDMEFRNEVIDQLLHSVDCARHFKASLGQFLANVTTDANHKHLAYHLFCTVTLYISRKTTLDEEQMTVLCRIIEQLRHEWGGDNASSESSHTPPHTIRTTDHDDVLPKQGHTSSTATVPRAEAGYTMNSTSKDIAKAGNVCEAVENTKITRSTTPDSFVRAAKKHTPTTPNFHEAVTPEDKADLKSQYPFGHRLMTKQGWSHRSGLGPDGSGIQRPIDADVLARAIGPAYAPKASGEAHANDNYTDETRTRADSSNGKARAWHQYVADPDTGDKSAKKGYGYDETADTTGRIRGTHGINASNNSNSRTFSQDNYVINDSWRGVSNRRSSPHVQDHVPYKVLEKKANSDSEKSVFVPCSGNSKG